MRRSISKLASNRAAKQRFTGDKFKSNAIRVLKASRKRGKNWPPTLRIARQNIYIHMYRGRLQDSSFLFLPSWVEDYHRIQALFDSGGLRGWQHGFWGTFDVSGTGWRIGEESVERMRTRLFLIFGRKWNFVEGDNCWKRIPFDFRGNNYTFSIWFFLSFWDIRRGRLYL